MTKVLHLTAHLGGGVGKALSGMAVQAARVSSPYEHTIVTLEEQEKPQFLEIARQCGCEVVVAPDASRLAELIEATDIFQLEWWNHPLTIKALCEAPLPPLRLAVWSHISGLYNPIIPAGLVKAAKKLLFTSPCSYEAAEVKALSVEEKAKTGYVSSSGGFDGFPPPTDDFYRKLSAGYIGSLNFAKLHPGYASFLAAVDLPDFSVRVIGDTTNREILEAQCQAAGKAGLLDFRGYTSNVVAELVHINVMPYLLNPEHYGTTENALIEAMSMGIVPIVLGNPAELRIIDDRVTGLVVSTAGEFRDAVRWLHDNPSEFRRIGMEAARSVRSRFTVEGMEATLNAHYADLLALGKETVDFSAIFGEKPYSWFLSCQRYQEVFTGNEAKPFEADSFMKYGLYEKTKGTAFHFHKYFPDDERLAEWTRKLSILE